MHIRVPSLNPKTLQNPHFWAIVALLGIGAAVLYLRHSILPRSAYQYIVDVIFLVPVGYALFTFGMLASFVTLALAAAIMVPSVLLASEFVTQAIWAVVAVVIVGSMAVSWSGSNLRKRDAQQRAFANLQTAYQALNDRVQTLEEQERHLRILNRVSGIVSQSLELSQILDRVIDNVIELMRADGSWIYLLDPENSEIVLSAYRGPSEEAIRMKVGKGLSGWVAEKGRVVSILNAGEDPRVGKTSGQQMRSVLVVPLISKSHVNGTLGVSSLTQRSFSQSEQQLLLAIAEQVGVAIDNASLYKKQQKIAWELHASEQRYRELFENAQDAIWVHDLEGDLIACNQATESLTGGYSAHELLTMNVRNFLMDESLALASQIKSRLLMGERVVQVYEQRITRKNGSQGLLKLTTTLLKKDGKPAAFLNIARDVTEERETQDKLNAAYRDLMESHRRLKESQEQLIHAEKLTSLGQLAANIAHEVNNPLSGVLVYDKLLMKKMKDGSISQEQALDYLSKMESELVRSTKLIRNLLDFARQSPPALRQVNLNEVVNRTFDLAAHTAELQHVSVTKELDPALPTLMADFDQLQQVCTNLIINAIQAMHGGGKLRLRTAADRDEVTLLVQDTGCGIAPENMGKLFTPFFTTKREVKGVGLGLAVSYGIIKHHHGRIEVQSKLGEGTAMTVHLPLKQELSEEELNDKLPSYSAGE
jgi:two-component system, NtrC family, sensor kinase